MTKQSSLPQPFLHTHTTAGCWARTVVDSGDLGVSPAYWELCLGRINEKSSQNVVRAKFIPVCSLCSAMHSFSRHQSASASLTPSRQVSFPGHASLITSNCLWLPPAGFLSWHSVGAHRQSPSHMEGGDGEGDGEEGGSWYKSTEKAFCRLSSPL